MKPRDLVLAGALVAAAAAALGVLRLTVFSGGGGTVSAAVAPAATPAARQALPTPVATPTPRPTYPLTGLPIGDDDLARGPRQRPIAVMLDNADAAYPQAGLDRADVVIEALVEGGITRFMAVYESLEAPVIEPVRSARTPFLHWALEFDAIYAHVGRAEAPGPADAGQQIAAWHVADIDMEGGLHPLPNAFFRDGGRLAPHNVITSTVALHNAAATLNLLRAPKLGEWRFSAPVPADSRFPLLLKVEVTFGGISTEHVTWTWDEAAGVYRRAVDGQPHRDGVTGQQLTATNVVVMGATHSVVDASGHVVIENVGQGAAQMYVGGRVIDGAWRKPDDASRTRFYDRDGNEVAFRPGNTWIEVVNPAGN